MMTPRFTEALTLAAKAHQWQLRKGTAIPYITHPVAVAGLVAKHGGDEDQQIAALLHDVLEDAGEAWALEIQAFGDRVYAIVRGCTDGVPDASGKKAPWKERKEAYLARLATVNDDVALVSACDKLHNLQAIRADVKELGVSMFSRFTAGQEGTLWYYGRLVEVFDTMKSPVATALATEFAGLMQNIDQHLTPMVVTR